MDKLITDDNILISVVSPVYRAERIVEELVHQLKENLISITENFEIILVNDASPDQSWDVISEECAKDKRVKGLNLSRNFGQHYAISAGLNYARGKWIVVMDCDLQDRPDEIPRLYNKALEGWDIVQATRVNRKDHFFKRVSSIVFHAVFSYLSGIKSNSDVANFGIYNRKVINEFNKMKETSRSFPSLLLHLGFKRTSLAVIHSERYEGATSYDLSKLVNLGLDIILSNSNKPLKLAVKIGLLISMISFILASYNIFAHLMGIITVQGFTSTIFSIWFVGGLVLFVLGVHGLYIGKIYDQVKERQMYIVEDELNF